MNQLLPAPRDLPPGRRAEIHAKIQQAVTQGESRRMRLAPVLTAVAAASALGLIIWLVPWQSGDEAQPAARQSTTQPQVPATGGQQPDTVIPGLSAADKAKIEHGCAQSAGVHGTPRLYNLVTDDAGKYALVYTENNVLGCDVDSPAMPYNSSYGGVPQRDWLPGDLSVDSSTGSAGGDGSKYPGEKGYLAVGGRITSKVTKVTFTADGSTVQANLANGTFIARVTRPSNWKLPTPTVKSAGIVRAYDANGNMIAASNDPKHPMDKCYITPDKKVVLANERTPNLATCTPATRWQ
jgi:hypothetical protein